MLIYLLLLSLLYQLLLVFLGRGLLKAEPKPRLIPIDKDLSIGILVVHRNNPKELSKTVELIQAQNKNLSHWPLYILDDHSAEEHQAELHQIAQMYEAQIIPSEAEGGKKKALQWFLPRLQEDFIIQTDSDCELGADYLQIMAQSIQETGAEMHIGRVEMLPVQNIWSRLAALDHLSLQLVTFSALKQKKVLMAAGASMAYDRKAFLQYLEVGKAWAGGEDTFVAQAMAEAGKTLKAMPYAVVRTEAPQNFNSFIAQRLRWGAKSSAYPNTLAKALAVSVALINLSFVAAVFLSPFVAIPQVIWMLWLYKMVGDALLLFRFSSFYGGGQLTRNYLVLALLYPFYISIIVLLSPFSAKDRWLGA